MSEVKNESCKPSLIKKAPRQIKSPELDEDFIDNSLRCRREGGGHVKAVVKGIPYAFEIPDHLVFELSQVGPQPL